MEGSRFLHNVEILKKGTIARHGLGSNARPTRGEVLGADFGDEFLERLGEESFAEGAAAFVPDHRGVAAEEIPESREGEDLSSFAGVDIGLSVAFAGEGENGIRAGFDAAVDEAGEVDSKEGKRWVGHGVDEVSGEMVSFGGEFEIFAAKGDNADIVFCASKGGDAIAKETSAIQEIACIECTDWGLKNPATKVVVNSEDAGVFLEGAAKAFDLSDEGVADRWVIDNAFLWNTEGSESGGVGFDLSKLAGVEPLETFEAILLAASFEFMESLDFSFGGGDDDLTADLVGDRVLSAEVGHEADSADSKAGLQRTGFVIKAAVEDPAVVSALMAAWAVFFFKNANGGTSFF